jgi:hypothetical protein
LKGRKHTSNDGNDGKIKGMTLFVTKPFTWFSLLVVIGRSGVSLQSNSPAFSNLFLALSAESKPAIENYYTMPRARRGANWPSACAERLVREQHLNSVHANVFASSDHPDN